MPFFFVFRPWTRVLSLWGNFPWSRRRSDQRPEESHKNKGSISAGFKAQEEGVRRVFEPYSLSEH